MTTRAADEFTLTVAPRCRETGTNDHPAFDVPERDEAVGPDRVQVMRCGYCGCRRKKVFFGGAGKSYVGNLPTEVRYAAH